MQALEGQQRVRRVVEDTAAPDDVMDAGRVDGRGVVEVAVHEADVALAPRELRRGRHDVERGHARRPGVARGEGDRAVDRPERAHVEERAAGREAGDELFARGAPYAPHGMPSPHGVSPPLSRSTPSSSAVRCHGLGLGSAGAGAGAVSRMKRSSAATTAAASSGEALGATISSCGRRLGTPPR